VVRALDRQVDRQEPGGQAALEHVLVVRPVAVRRRAEQRRR